MNPAETELALEPISDLARWEADWTRLAEATGHPFASWEWNSIWWKHFGGDGELCSWACRADTGELRGILPLYVAARRPVRVARLLGYADLQSPLCNPVDRPAVTRALIASTRRPGGCRLVVAERLPGGLGWSEQLSGAPISTTPSPSLLFEGRSWDEILGKFSRKHRGNLRRAEERLRSDHGLNYRLATDPQRLEEDMRTLFRLHDARWGGGSTGVFEGARAEFHLELAAAALERGWLRLWLAEVDGEPAAAWYGFRFANLDWHLQSGRDPRFDRLSVGTAILVHAVRSACEDGMSGFHFLAGDEPYKLRFAERDDPAETWMVGRPAAVRAARLAVALRERVSRFNSG